MFALIVMLAFPCKGCCAAPVDSACEPPVSAPKARELDRHGPPVPRCVRTGMLGSR